MRVIKKKGNVAHKVIKCPECGCAFECSMVDIVRSYDSVWKAATRCPDCHSAIRLPEFDEDENAVKVFGRET